MEKIQYPEDIIKALVEKTGIARNKIEYGLLGPEEWIVLGDAAGKIAQEREDHAASHAHSHSE